MTTLRWPGRTLELTLSLLDDYSFEHALGDSLGLLVRDNLPGAVQCSDTAHLFIGPGTYWYCAVYGILATPAPSPVTGFSKQDPSGWTFRGQLLLYAIFDGRARVRWCSFWVGGWHADHDWLDKKEMNYFLKLYTGCYAGCLLWQLM